MTELALYLLGSPRFDRNGLTIDINRRKGVALVAYLAAAGKRGESLSRDTLTTLLWPEFDRDRARAALRRTLSWLNKDLGIGWLNATRETVALNPQVWVDLTHFRMLLARCPQPINPADQEACEACIAVLSEALALYRGDFLDGLTVSDSVSFDEWQSFQTNDLRRSLTSALDKLITCYLHQQAFEMATTTAHRRLQLDPLHEPTHRQLMRLHAQTGQRAAALQQYQTCVQLLDEELGLEPSQATVILYQQLRATASDTPASLKQPAQDNAIEIIETAPNDGSPAGNSQPDAQGLGVSDLLQSAEPTSLTSNQKGTVHRTPHNLPTLTIPFVGRQQELKQITDRLNQPDCALVTLTGPGGIGKTRLAIQAAKQQTEVGAAAKNEQAYPLFLHGIYFVPLVTTLSHDTFLSTLAKAIGFSFYDYDRSSFLERREAQESQLLNYLQNKKMLLLLDNFEQLGHQTDLPLEILQQAPGVKLLVTSREPLYLQSEWVLEVEGLPFPKLGIASEIQKYESVQLFVSCAQQAQANFALSPQNAAAISRICRLLEGMPLGIELAANWVRIFSCQEIAARIVAVTNPTEAAFAGQSADQANLDFLATSFRDVPKRHRSLRAVFSYSWDLLSTKEQQQFCRLSVFRRGFQEDAAQVITDMDLSALAALVDKSLVRRYIPQQSGRVRFFVQEVVRQFAAEKLAEDEQAYEKTHKAHCDYYARFLEEREAQLREGNVLAALNEIELENDNIRASWQWAVDHWQVAQLQQSLNPIFRFYRVRNRLQEVNQLIAQAIEKAGIVKSDYQSDRQTTAFPQITLNISELIAKPEFIVGHLLVCQGEIFVHLHRLEEAHVFLEAGVAVLRQFEAGAALAAGLRYLGSVLTLSRNETDEVLPEQLQLESLEIYRRLEDLQGISATSHRLAESYMRWGHFGKARDLAQQSLSVCEATDDWWNMVDALNTLAYVTYLLDDFPEVYRIGERSLALSQEIGYQTGVTLAYRHLTWSSIAMGHYEQAKAYLQTSMALCRELGSWWEAAVCLYSLGKIARYEGDWPQAETLQKQTLSVFRDRRRFAQAKHPLIELGKLAYLQDQRPQAKQYYLDALQMAVQTQSLTFALAAVVGLAQIALEAGDLEAPAMLLQLAQRHEATQKETRDEATHTLTNFSDQIPVAVIEQFEDQFADLSAKAQLQAIAALIKNYLPSDE